MEAQYILIRKNKSQAKKIKIQSEIKSMLKEASLDVGHHLIYFSKDNEDEYVEFCMSYEDNNSLYLDIKTELNGKSGAILLDKFDRILTKGKHREKFYIINAYSDSSFWFCSKLMPKLAIFERSLRQLIYLVLVEKRDSEWIKAYTLEQKKKIAEISNGKISNDNSFIEESLEWLDYGALEEFLFTPRILDNTDETDTIIKELINNNSLSKEEIISQLKKIEKKTLWDEAIQGFTDIKDLHERIKKIRKIRNTIMHNKFVSLQYFDESISIIEKINKQLINSIQIIKNQVYNESQRTNTIFIDSQIICHAILQDLYFDEVP